jgi:hypothetical protein
MDLRACLNVILMSKIPPHTKNLIQIVKPESSHSTDSVTVAHVANCYDAKLRIVMTD